MPSLIASWEAKNEPNLFSTQIPSRLGRRRRTHTTPAASHSLCLRRLDLFAPLKTIPRAPM